MSAINIAAYERQVERVLLDHGKRLSAPVNNRIDELIQRLKVYFPITGLRMGMGTYFLLGKDVPIVYGDGSEGAIPMSELLDYMDGKVWEPLRLTKRNDKMLRELKRLLDYLTDAPYMPLYQFGSEPRSASRRKGKG